MRNGGLPSSAGARGRVPSGAEMLLPQSVLRVGARRPGWPSSTSCRAAAGLEADEGAVAVEALALAGAAG